STVQQTKHLRSNLHSINKKKDEILYTTEVPAETSLETAIYVGSSFALKSGFAQQTYYFFLKHNKTTRQVSTNLPGAT
ncbi:MAG: hypothetical protein R6X09_11010, partial [Bacteroidales bacterium]